MIRNWSFAHNLAALLGGLMAAACSQAVDDQVDEIESASEAIIDGSPAKSSKYDAIGAVGIYFDATGDFMITCSATLIDKKTIVTARHCTPYFDLAEEGVTTAVFAIGEQAFELDEVGFPKASADQVIPITAYVNAPSLAVNGGLMGDGGRDIAVAYLESAPKGVKPAKLGKFAESLIGKRFQIAGFGERAPGGLPGFNGERYAGVATARSLGGPWYQSLFNHDRGAFDAWYFSGDAPASSFDPGEAEIWWNFVELEPGFELHAGGLPGEAVPCHIDSGGPLFLSQGQDITLYGVAFAVEDSLSTVCGFGGGYVVLNETILDFVKDSLVDDDSKPRKHKKHKVKKLPKKKKQHGHYRHYGFSHFHHFGWHWPKRFWPGHR